MEKKTKYTNQINPTNDIIYGKQEPGLNEVKHLNEGDLRLNIASGTDSSTGTDNQIDVMEANKFKKTSKELTDDSDMEKVIDKDELKFEPHVEEPLNNKGIQDKSDEADIEEEALDTIDSKEERDDLDSDINDEDDDESSEEHDMNFMETDEIDTKEENIPKVWNLNEKKGVDTEGKEEVKAEKPDSKAVGSGESLFGSMFNGKFLSKLF